MQNLVDLAVALRNGGRRVLPRVFCLVAFVVAGGCRSEKFTEYPVDPQEARLLLELVFKSWQEGQTPEFWRTKTPPIIVQDFDWATGRKLVAFEIGGNERPVDAQLRCDARLTFEAAGKRETVNATYLIGATPVVTVFRQ